MSVTAFPHIVGWDKLVEECAKHQNSGFFLDAVEEFEEEGIDKEGRIKDDYFDGVEHWLQPTGWIGTSDWNNWDAACEASWAYDAMRLELSEATRNSCDKFFSALFWGSESFPAMRDLPQDGGGNDIETFAITMNPATVNEYLQLGQSIALEELRVPFENTHKKRDWFQEFGAFEEYILGWIGMLDEASMKSAGLVVTVA